MREEGDRFVLGLALDFLNARNVEFRVAALRPDLGSSFLRDHSDFSHGVRGMCFDFEVDSVFGLIRPDCGHLRTGVARYHVPRPPNAKYLISRKSSMPYFEPSRPIPLCFMPPKGATSVEMMPSLMPIMPYSGPSATRITRPRSRA